MSHFNNNINIVTQENNEIEYLNIGKLDRINLKAHRRIKTYCDKSDKSR